MIRFEYDKDPACLACRQAGTDDPFAPVDAELTAQAEHIEELEAMVDRLTARCTVLVEKAEAATEILYSATEGEQ